MAQIPIKMYGGGSRKGPANYKLIYYLGNEFANPTEEEQRYAIATGGWNGSNWTPRNNIVGRGGFETVNTIKIENTYKGFVVLTPYGYSSLPVTTVQGSISFGDTKNTATSPSPDYAVVNNYCSATGMANNTKVVLMGGLLQTKTVVAILGALLRNGQASQGAIITDKDTNRLRCSGTSSSVSGSNFYFYCAGFVGVDDISKLSAYGNDIATILSNSATLFQDERAITYIANKCTGDFMISALSNSTFLTQLNNSSNPNTEIIKADEDWARMIALLSI